MKWEEGSKKHKRTMKREKEAPVLLDIDNQSGINILRHFFNFSAPRKKPIFTMFRKPESLLKARNIHDQRDPVSTVDSTCMVSSMWRLFIQTEA